MPTTSRSRQGLPTTYTCTVREFNRRRTEWEDRPSLRSGEARLMLLHVLDDDPQKPAKLNPSMTRHQAAMIQLRVLPDDLDEPISSINAGHVLRLYLKRKTAPRWTP